MVRVLYFASCAYILRSIHPPFPLYYISPISRELLKLMLQGCMPRYTEISSVQMVMEMNWYALGLSEFFLHTYRCIVRQLQVIGNDNFLAFR